MTSESYFRIKKPDVIFEEFDDEIVLINLENGNYYSIQGTAAEIWSLVEAGFHQSGILQEILHRYRGDPQDVGRTVDGFLDELSADRLIEPYEPEEKADRNAAVKNLPVEPVDDRPAFAPPVLHRFTDMQQLLLLDPIHEVGEQGWPDPQSDIP